MKPEQRDYLETIRNSGNALLAVINDILDYSKIDGDKLELEILPFDLTGCIEISMDLVAAKAAEKGLELTYFQKDDVPTMLIGDEIRLRQILINLLGNAVKFTEKGEVMLSVSSSPADDGKVELHFEVKDTGIGISQENLGKLFQFFTQVDSSTTRHYGGTGLGLAISRRLVEMMGGKIWAESERGRRKYLPFHHYAVLPGGHGAGFDVIGSESCRQESANCRRQRVCPKYARQNRSILGNGDDGFGCRQGSVGRSGERDL